MSVMEVLAVQQDKIMKKILMLFMIMVLIVGCSSKEPEKETETVDDDKISFLAVGDNLMHERLLDCAKTDDGYDFSPYYSNIKSYIQKADLSFVNQETILGGDTLGATGYPAFNTPEVMAKNLSDLGFDIVNGATNHTLDKGYNAVVNSINVFKKYKNLTYIGVNETKESREIPVVEKNGIKIAFLSYDQYSNKEDNEHRFCINRFDDAQIKQDVENAKEISDFIIVSCHWGEEYDIAPNNFQKKYAKMFADLGVNVILGTHSHTLQPVEWVEGTSGNKTLVAYSLGNFVSGMLEEETQLEGMLTFDLKKEDNQVNIDNVVLTPLMNHYEATNVQNIMETRENFTVYRLKDYSEELAKKHGLNGYQGIQISFDKMKQKVKERITSGIKIDM